MAAPVGSVSRKYCDIGANLTDSMFSGSYNDHQRHAPDLEAVLGRAWEAGVNAIIITGTDYESCVQAFNLAKSDPRLFCTVGIHPTHCNDFDTNPELKAQLLALAREGMAAGKVVAIGECGLDFDRTHFCPKDVQLRNFPIHFELAKETGLPMFLHCRAAHCEFLELMSANRESWTGGVAHSHTGTGDEALELAGIGLYIGLNGCSLKSAENLAAVKVVPLDRLLLETDAPWCSIKATHDSFKHVRTTYPEKKPEKYQAGQCVKGRCEPCHIVQVAEVVAAVQGRTVDEVAEAAWSNSQRLFFSRDAASDKK